MGSNIRIHAPFSEDVIRRIDQEAKEKGISRAQWLCAAASVYLDNGGANPTETAHEVSLLQKDLDHALNTVAQRDRQIAFLEAHVSQLTQSLSQLALTGPKTVVEEERPKEPEYINAKTPLWKRMKFWTWV